MEVALKRLEGVDQVTISMQRQQFVVNYKGGASFAPKDVRAAVAQTSVSVVRFQIQARGRVQAQGDKQFFVAGKDRFLLVSPPKMPAEQLLLVGGEILKDSVIPMELKVVDFRPASQP